MGRGENLLLSHINAWFRAQLQHIHILDSLFSLSEFIPLSVKMQLMILYLVERSKGKNTKQNVLLFLLY